MTALATPAELAMFLGITIEPATPAHDRATMLLELASDEVRHWSRQQIDFVAQDTVTLTGGWDEHLHLPQRPASNVTAVTVNGLAVSDYHVNGSVLTRGHLADGVYAHWAGPHTTVTVTYDHGWTEVPGEIKAVVLGMAARGWGNPSAIRQESILGYSVTYAVAELGIGMSKDDRRRLHWLKFGRS